MVNIVVKTCTRCGVEKEITLFQKRAASKDGLTSSCKECLSNYDKQRANLPHRVNARIEYSKTDAYKKSHIKAAKKYKSVKKYRLANKDKASRKVLTDQEREERRKASLKKYNSSEKRKLVSDRYTKSEKYKTAHSNYIKTESWKNVSKKAQDKWRSNNNLKRAAHVAISHGVAQGKIIRPIECSECGCEGVKIHGHHDDYAFPLSVRWLCSKCHRFWHKINGEAINSKEGGGNEPNASP